LSEVILWGLFGLLTVPVLWLDLVWLHRSGRLVGMRQAACWSGLWCGLALLYSVAVFLLRGGEAGTEFVLGYLLELSLSADNVFLFAVIFSYFSVPEKHQHRVLLYGIVGAILLRGAMILGGVALIERFSWTIYLFGAFLILTGAKLFLHRDREPDLAESAIIRWLRRILPVSEHYDGTRFLTRINGRMHVTPLFLVMVFVDAADVMFATDSIPAIFAVTRDPFIIFSSNIFAIVGLRSLYTLLAGVMGRFVYVKVALSAILVLVGVKMLSPVAIPAWISLAAILFILGLAIVASARKSRPQPEPSAEPSQAAPLQT
jgi:tellurite resistance protein TerC